MNDLTFCEPVITRIYQESGIWRLNDGVTTFKDAEAVATWIYERQSGYFGRHVLKGMRTDHPLAEAYRLVISSRSRLHWDLNWFFAWWFQSYRKLHIEPLWNTQRLETPPATFLKDEPVFMTDFASTFIVLIQGEKFGGGRLRNLVWWQPTQRLQVRECLGSVGIGKDPSIIIEGYLMSYALLFEEFEDHRRSAFRAFNGARPPSIDFRIPMRAHLNAWVGDGILRLEFAL